MREHGFYAIYTTAYEGKEWTIAHWGNPISGVEDGWWDVGHEMGISEKSVLKVGKRINPEDFAE